jgi:hypothetical protein
MIIISILSALVDEVPGPPNLLSSAGAAGGLLLTSSS